MAPAPKSIPAPFGTPFTVIGSAEAIRDFLFGPPDHSEHVKAWRWHLFTQGAGETEQQIRVRLDAERRAARRAA